MRGLAKALPPANVSPDDQAPRSFADAEREYLAALPGRPNKVGFARSEFGRLEKRRLRQVMYGEQGSLCVYCERELQEDDGLPHVEHWRPLHADPGLALHWRNLYLSCATADTCDGAKGGQPLKAAVTDPDLPWPTELAYESLVGFTSRGEMYVRDDAHMGEVVRRALELAIADRSDDGRRRKAILNLNHPTLVAARSAALDSERTRLRRVFDNRPPTRDERQHRATQLLDREQLPEFVSIRVAWLRNRLGRGR